MEILIFDISSEYGHFRKFNTTTSPLTYSIPPRTAVTGMLGAIMGIDRFTYIGWFSKENAVIATQIINPVKKVHVAFNLVNTKESFFNITNRTQIDFELVKDAKYRIFFWHKDSGLFSEVVNRIKNNRHHFSPYLGLSQFTARVEYVDLAESIEKSSDDYVDLASALNMNYCITDQPVQFDYEAKYSSNLMAIEMKLDEVNERIVTEYADVLIETGGKPVRAKVNNYNLINNYGNIKFL